MTKRQPEMSEVSAAGQTALAALDYAHSKGVVHNFLNPSNIKVLPDARSGLASTLALLRDKNLLTQTPNQSGKRTLSFSGAGEEQTECRLREIFFNAGNDHLSALHGAQSVPRAASGRSGPQHYRRGSAPMQMAHPRVPEQISKVVLKRCQRILQKICQRPAVLCRVGRSAKAAPVPRANSTGSMPAYQGPGRNASQSMRAVPGPNASQSFQAVPGPNASQSFQGNTVSFGQPDDEGTDSGNPWERPMLVGRQRRSASR